MLPLVLLLVLALELAAHGALLMAREEVAASRTAAALLQARLVAESGVRTAFREPPAAAYTGVPSWETTEAGSGGFGTGRFSVRLRRLARERWMVEGEGWVEPAEWRVEVGHAAWLPDPVERLRAFGAVVVVGEGVELPPAGAIDVSGVRRDAPELEPPPCAPLQPALDSLFGGAPPPPVRAEPMTPAREPSLGALRRDQLLAWIGAGGASGWGPRAFSGDVHLVDTLTFGLLVAAGDVEIEAGRHEGVVLAGGTLTLRAGATVTGFVRAAGGLRMESDTRVVGSGCRALLALSTDLERWIRPLPIGGGPFPLR